MTQTQIHSRWLSCGLVAALVLCSGAARADDGDDEEDLTGFRIGIKGALTLAGQTAPDSPPSETAAFVDSSPGVGFGGGLYGELRATKLLGVELDLLFVSNRLYYVASANDLDFEQYVSFEQLRIPLLAKLYHALSANFDLNVALGPELIVGLGGRAENTLTGNGTTLSDAQIESQLDYFQQAESALGAAVAVEIGCSIYTLRYQIPIALRFAYNVLGSTAYDERVTVDEATRIANLGAIESFQVGLVVGFGFLIPPRDPPPPPVEQRPAPDDPFAPFSRR